jgi:subtilisin family serine protease
MQNFNPQPANSCSSILESKFKEWNLSTSPNDTASLFLDPLFGSQWHIHNTGQMQFSFKATPGHDINVLPVYQQYQLFGAGVTVGVVDDGIEWRHPDLQCGYQPELSADVDLDIKFQEAGPFDGHGTCCAGICCGQGNNSACGIGIAFKAKNAGIRVLGNNFSDAKCAESLVYGLEGVDIYSNSWGPSDDGRTIERYPLALSAIEKGIEEGRKGLGAIYVWAAGNGYPSGDGSNFDELANSPYTISIGASDWNGKYSTYSEPGTNLLANAPSSTRGYDKPSNSYKYYSTMVTADRMGFTGYNHAAGAEGNCAFDFGGTSAACPLAAGVLALVLEANPKLTWRDIQWIIAKSSTRTDLEHSSWQQNKAGIYHSKHYGFGRLNAYDAVTMAKSWTNVCSNYTLNSKQFERMSNGNLLPATGLDIPKNSSKSLTLSVSFSDLPDMIVESVYVSVTASTKRRGQLVFAVASPNGTVSVVSEGRDNDKGTDYYKQVFSTVQLWGEHSLGTWSFAIYDNDRDKTIPAQTMATLLDVEITVTGSYVDCSKDTENVAEPSPKPTPLSSWLSLRIRNVITVSLISVMSLAVVVIVMVLVFKMQRSAATELNSDIWNEMKEEDDKSQAQNDQERNASTVDD